MLNSNLKAMGKSKSIKHYSQASPAQGGINFYRLYLTATALELDELVFEIGSNPDYEQSFDRRFPQSKPRTSENSRAVLRTYTKHAA